MPPKKRPAAASAVTSTAKRAKKVSIGGASIMGEPDTSETFASGRAKRSSTGEPNYNTKKPKIGPPPTKNPGRKAIKTTDTAPLPPVKRSAGRPRKDASAASETANPPSTPPAAKPVGRPAGRPKKSPSSKFTRVKTHSSPPTARQTLKKAGRPKQTLKSPKASPAKSTAKPTKTRATTRSPSKATSKPNTTSTGKPRGRPKGVKSEGKSKTTKADPEPYVQGEDLGGVTANESDWDNAEDDDGKQYWLMKAEPESRMEKGVDVKFSIDDLQNTDKPEPWDGVRNPVARNHMRAMKKGDQAFFYHSNCKVPGIVGILEIVEEHSIDESAFDENHPYYDPKSSRDKPKWEVVHVKFVRKFSDIISLAELRSFAKPGGALENLQTLKQSRLSVSAVKPREWRFIHGLVEADELENEPDEDAGAVKGQVLKVSEEVVRKVNSEGVEGELVNGSYGAGGEDEAIQSKLTTSSMTGKDETEVES